MKITDFISCKTSKLSYNGSKLNCECDNSRHYFHVDNLKNAS